MKVADDIVRLAPHKNRSYFFRSSFNYRYRKWAEAASDYERFIASAAPDFPVGLFKLRLLLCNVALGKATVGGVYTTFKNAFKDHNKLIWGTIYKKDPAYSNIKDLIKSNKKGKFPPGQLIITHVVERNLTEEELKPTNPKCDQCQATFTRTFVCNRCKKTRYCTTACQKKAWPTHKLACTNKKKE